MFKVLNELPEMYSLVRIKTEINQSPEFSHLEGWSMFNLGETIIGTVYRIRNNGRTFDVFYPTKMSSQPRGVTLDLTFIEKLSGPSNNPNVLLDFCKRNGVSEFENLDYEDAEKVYPKSERMPHEILNDSSDEELLQAYGFRFIVDALIRCTLALNSYEEKIELSKKQAALKQSPNVTTSREDRPIANKRTKPGIVEKFTEQGNISYTGRGPGIQELAKKLGIAKNEVAEFNTVADDILTKYLNEVPQENSPVEPEPLTIFFEPSPAE